MTTHPSHRPTTPATLAPAPITAAAMAELVATGRARHWDRPLGDVLPMVARVEDTWYVVTESDEDYHPANGPLADTLTQLRTILDTADQAVAHADDQDHPAH
jgi:hypothetical protein